MLEISVNSFLYSEPGHSPFEYYKNYVNTYLERDIVQIAAVHDLIRFEKFLRLLAGRTGQLVNNSALATEIGVSSPTIGSWISNGLEIDLILKEEGKLKLFEIKNGKALNEEFCKNMKNFSARYREDIFNDSNDGIVIYSGECYESYKKFGFYNFSQISELFNTKKQSFRLDF